MPFLTKGVFSHVEGTKDLNLLRTPLEYWSARYDTLLTVPAGFKTDFASIPRIFRSIVARSADQQEPATLHDYLYNKATKYKHLGRKQCDKLFLDALKDKKVGRLKRWAMYNAVRAGGWVGFRKRSKV